MKYFELLTTGERERERGREGGGGREGGRREGGRREGGREEGRREREEVGLYS